MTTVNDNNRGFVEGTVVRMADGKLKPIERIVPGDWVMSFDTESARSELEPREVIDVFKYVGRDVLEVRSDDDSLMVMPGQLFLTPGMDWSFAQDSAFITDEQGNTRSFEIIKNKQGKQRIYDIIVDDNHSLIANGFRVHNGYGSDTVGGGSDPQAGGSGSVAAEHSAEGQAVRGGDTPGFGTGGAGTGSIGGGGGYGNSPEHGSFGFADNGNNGFNSDTRGNDNGGRGDRGDTPVRSFRGSKSKPRAPKAPPIDPKAQAYAAYSAISDTMDYICDIMVQFTASNYFSVRTAAYRYMGYARALAVDALANVFKSDMSMADKDAIDSRNYDLKNGFRIIEDAFKGDPNQASANLESINRACLNNKMWIDMQQTVISKYIGSQKSSITYTLPGYSAPAPVNLAQTPVSRAYVQTAPGVYVTSTYSPIGTTTVQDTTGGLGASYTKTRVVRGFLYSYAPGKGWAKVGPADQYRSIS